jgi:hypothetical protein
LQPTTRKKKKKQYKYWDNKKNRTKVEGKEKRNLIKRARKK